jgi:hypothetical protein
VLGSVAMLVTAVLCWAMGSELLFDPWQPHSLLLPFLFFLMAVWALSCGDLVMLPWVVGVGSLVCRRTSATPTSSCAWPVGPRGLRADLAAHGRDRGSGGRAGRASWRRAGAATGSSSCSAGPNPSGRSSPPGRRNLTCLVQSVGIWSAPIGFDRATKLVATVLTLPPWWMRPSFNDDFVSQGSLGRGRRPRRQRAAVAHALRREPSILAILVLCVRRPIGAEIPTRRSSPRDRGHRRPLHGGKRPADGLRSGSAPVPMAWPWPPHHVRGPGDPRGRVIEARPATDRCGRGRPGRCDGARRRRTPDVPGAGRPDRGLTPSRSCAALDQQFGGLEHYGTLLYDFHGAVCRAVQHGDHGGAQRATFRLSSTSTGSCASSVRTGASTGPTRYRIFYRIGEDTLRLPNAPGSPITGSA